eukprot:gb/GEZN01012858.1/.p1 GENE.gb/GEZN01012858.1/~~gb/GEZN01012858.1/.p1  ORF type:complete len:279 (+),score=48.93 gb/GEZN01012858.1/:95-931(+)
MLSILLALLGVALGQYKVTYIYADYLCSTLMAVKSEPIYDGDSRGWLEDSDNLTPEQRAYDDCVEELDDEGDCLAGEEVDVVVYLRKACSMAKAKMSTSKSKIMVTEYEDACPSRGGVPVSYTSLSQQCLPVGLNLQRDEAVDDADNMEKYFFYAVECDKRGAITTLKCTDSHCSNCVSMTAYKEGYCYNPEYKKYVTIDCDGTSNEFEWTNEKSTVKISKVVVVLVSVFLGLLFLGAGAVMYRRKAAETEIGRAGAHVQAQRGLDSDYRSFGAVANN